MDVTVVSVDATVCLETERPSVLLDRAIVELEVPKVIDVSVDSDADGVDVVVCAAAVEVVEASDVTSEDDERRVSEVESEVDEDFDVFWASEVEIVVEVELVVDAVLVNDEKEDVPVSVVVVVEDPDEAVELDKAADVNEEVDVDNEVVVDDAVVVDNEVDVGDVVEVDNTVDEEAGDDVDDEVDDGEVDVGDAVVVTSDVDIF